MGLSLCKMGSFDQEIKRREEYRRKRLDNLHKEAKTCYDPRGYQVDVGTFDFLLTAGNLLSQNEPTVDNCYVHRLKSLRGLVFKTITETVYDFNPPF